MARPTDHSSQTGGDPSALSAVLDDGLRQAGLNPEEVWTQASGLAPAIWLVPGPGFTREEIKAALLSRGLGFVGQAVVGFDDLALEVLKKLPAPDDPQEGYRIAQSPFRQEVLRTLLDLDAISRFVPELDRLRKQTPFLRRLDRALQAGRSAYSIDAELEAMESQLLDRQGGPTNPVRPELKLIAPAFEAWLRAHGWLDPVLLFRESRDRLDEANRMGEPLPGFPSQVIVFASGTLEPLQAEWLAALGRCVELRRVGVNEERPKTPSADIEWSWERAHTLDDAAEFFADELLGQMASEGPSLLQQSAVLIPDQPEIRRSLLRVLKRRGVPLEDARDPTRIRTDELMKRALLPLEVVASRFERDRVLAFLSFEKEFRSDAGLLADATREIFRRGVSQGIESYRGGKLSLVHEKLTGLLEKWNRRFTAVELSAFHALDLRERMGVDEAWIASWFETQWLQLAQDLRPIEEDRGQGPRAMPLLAWLERLRHRMQDASPPADAISTPGGLRLYRLNQQAPFRAETVWFFGLPADWFQGEGSSGTGDYFFTKRERELLSADHPLRSVETVRRERRAALFSWLDHAKKIRVIDAEFDWDGSERAGVWPLLSEFGFPRGADPTSGAEMGEPEPMDRGAHPRWRRGYSSERWAPRTNVFLPWRTVPLDRRTGLPLVTASQLEAQSRCGFIGLAQGRWRLDDLKPPGPSPWPEERGKLLHEAARILMTHRSPGGGFNCTPLEALDQAWTHSPPRGLLPSRRFRENARRNMLRVLESFCEVEREWQSRAPTESIALDQEELRLETQEYIITGRPDRVDRWNHHLIVIDYKTGSLNPTGNRILEHGTRLQMPFYGLAAQARWNEPVAGTQFVVLGRENDRSRGIFFESFVDTSMSRKKLEPPVPSSKPFRFSSRNGSIVKIELEEGWRILRERVDQTTREYLVGSHHPIPRDPDECDGCRFALVCGFDRAGGPPGVDRNAVPPSETE